ncbi:hypothetical protein C0991_000386, partial [Blastosporella zonata]
FFGSQWAATGTFTYGSPLQTPFTPYNQRPTSAITPVSKPAQRGSRKRPNDENLPCLPPTHQPKQRKKLPISEKVDIFFDLLADFGWTYGELIYYTSGGTDEKDGHGKIKINKPPSTNRSQISVAKHFHHGRTSYGVGHMLA